MRKAVSIFGDKEYITSITQNYVFFRFADGSQDRLKVNKTDIKELYDWAISEKEFYSRMYDELSESCRKQRETLKKRHYYTEGEIDAACKKNRFASIDMEIRNEEYMKESHRISGLATETIRINNKYWKYADLTRQIQAVLRNLV